VGPSPRYLDRQNPIDNVTTWFWLDSWVEMYSVDPTENVSRAQASQVLGGEACMWMEQVSSLSIHERIWPRASAVAERLWSPATVNDSSEAAQRLARFRCRLASDGLPVGPVWSDYCSGDDQQQVTSNNDGPTPDSPSPLTTSTIVTLVFLAFLLGVVCTYVLSECITKKESKKNDVQPPQASSQPPLSSQQQQRSSQASKGFARSSEALGYTAVNVSNGDSLGTKDYADETDDERRALLPRSTTATSTTAASSSFQSSSGTPTTTTAATTAKSAVSHDRVQSIDVFRGVTVALMIFVDNVGEAFPVIHHSPWDGVRLADFVMPFFDFLVTF
jgi:hypothetical protein